MIGFAVLAAAIWGVRTSAHACVAQFMYYEAKRGQYAGHVDRVLSQCRKAYDLYPWNYYFAIHAAESAYYGAGDRGTGQWAERMESARLWCDRGLALNPWKSQLRRLKSRLLWEESPGKAIAYWRAYTDWQYWEPYNHEVLAEMYAKAGDFEQAERETRLIASFPADDRGERARQMVDKERKRWDAMLNDEASKWGE